MTARDAATDTDPTDEVVSADDAAPAPGEQEDAAPAAADAEAGTTTAGSSASDAGSASDDAASEDDDSDDTPVEPSRRRGRRHRHAAGDDDTPAAPGRPRRRWPVVALLVVCALFAGAMVALWAVTRPDPVAGLSGPQQAAVDAASQAAVNLQTFRRASFDQDFANALASLTSDYGTQQFAPRKDALKEQLTKGGRDTSATVQSAGLVSSTASEAVVLVVTTSVQTADDGTSTPFTFSRLRLTMQLTDGTWLVSDLTSVGLT